MSEHAHPTVTRRCDVAVVGGSVAGLAAALQLGRQHRSVIVVDAGEPRNAPAEHLHGYLGHEGARPADLVGIGRDEVHRYGGEVLPGRALGVERTDDGHFRVGLVGGHTIIARRVLAATGLVDELPDIEGLRRHWGTDVIHCPFCHGYEVRDRRIVQIVTHSAGLHPSSLFRQLTDRLTIVVHDGPGSEPIAGSSLDALRAAGVEILTATVRRIVNGDDGRLVAVELVDGRRIEADAVAVGPRFRARIEPFRQLGLEAVPHPMGIGDHVETDPTGATSVPGLYAAGNVTDPGHQLLQAAADGGRVGAMIAFALADEDLRCGRARRSAAADDWDERYLDAPVWSGNPNGSLVAEVAGLPRGRALDVGAGEGGDALWLAERGWTVVASDLSAAGLDRMTSEADRRRLMVTPLVADANDSAPFGGTSYDLVTVCYPAIPRTADDRAVGNLLGAVGPGGTLLVVGHDLEPMRSPIDTATQSRPYDPDAYVGIDDVATAVAAAPGWEIVVHETRPRPAGSASDAHHHDDVVFRARRVG